MEERGDSARDAAAASSVRWHEVAESAAFQRLQSQRRRITAGLLGVFVVVFGAFLVCCGYARPFMRRSVDGGLTVAYVWVLSLTVLAWILVWLYLRFAERPLGPLAERAIEEHDPGSAPQRPGSERGRPGAPGSERVRGEAS